MSLYAKTPTPTTTIHSPTHISTIKQLPSALYRAALALDLVMRRPGSPHRRCVTVVVDVEEEEARGGLLGGSGGDWGEEEEGLAPGYLKVLQGLLPLAGGKAAWVRGLKT